MRCVISYEVEKIEVDDTLLFRVKMTGTMSSNLKASNELKNIVDLLNDK